MGLLIFILNLPWTLAGCVGALLSGPRKLTLSSKPFALIFYVRSFWWWTWLPGQRGTRALANGQCIQLGPRASKEDLAHELIHVKQAQRQPFIHPILYALENLRVGYKHNKYEQEAYTLSGSKYEEI